MWDHPIVLAEDDSKIFLAETVGYGQMDDKERTRLFSVLFSICSGIIYCSTSPLNDGCFENVPELGNIRNWVEVYEDNKQLSDLYLESISPYFVWGTLKQPGQLTDTSGNKVTVNQVFEQLLQSSTRADLTGATVREQLVNTFRRRDCIDISGMDQASSESSKVREALKPNVLAKCKPKKVDGSMIEGQLLVSYCLGIVDAINSGMPAVFPTVISSAAAFDLKELLTKAKLDYSAALKTNFGTEIVYPRKEILETKLTQIRNEAFGTLNSADSLAQADPELYLASLIDLDKFIEQRETAARSRQQELKKK